MFLFVFCLLLFFQMGCNGSNHADKLSAVDSVNIEKIKTADASVAYSGKMILKDQRKLNSGWLIEYLVKDDSTKHKDIIIRWSNKNKSCLYYGESLQELKSYFTPYFASENDGFIFMEHACANNCKAVLVLSKKTLNYQDYYHINNYDTITNRIVWLSDENYLDETKFTVSVTDLNSMKTKPMHFQNLALGSVKESYIDTVLFHEHKVKVNCTLLDRKDDFRQREIKESQTAFF